MRELPIYNAIIDGQEDGVFAVSLVESPAVESLWQAFAKQDNKEKTINFSIQDEQQHVILGCILRANHLIYRRDGDFEYYLNFTPEQIKKFAEQIMRDGTYKNIDLNHDGRYNVEGVRLLQMFIKDSKKGINPNGFDDVADGSLFAMYKIDSIDLWNDIQEGKFQGFSVEAWLSVKEVDNNDNKNENMSKIDKVKDLMNSLFSALNEALSEEEVAQSAPSNEIATEETVEEQPEETEEVVEFIPDEETETVEETEEETVEETTDDEETETVEDTDTDFERRISELQSQIEELTNTNEELSSQIEELKKTAPSLTELSKNEVNTETRKTGTMLDYLAAIKR